jgi:HD-like signal output (HDOD) protein
MPTPEFHPPHDSPELSVRCRELFRLCDDAEPDLQQIARQAREIPVLAQRLMQRVNSASMGLRGRVAQVEQAAVLLGTDRIRGVVEQLLQETARLQELSRSSLPAPAENGARPPSLTGPGG